MKHLLNKGSNTLTDVHKECGGGFYGAIAVFTWLWVWIPLTYTEWTTSWSESSGIFDFILTELIFDFGIDAAINAFIAGWYALIWPLYWYGVFF